MLNRQSLNGLVCVNSSMDLREAHIASFGGTLALRRSLYSPHAFGIAPCPARYLLSKTPNSAFVTL
ncbi:MAG: hypothetical protein ACXV74_01905 [Methylobacter sp.]